MDYPKVRKLGASGPEGVKAYLKWILEDPARTASAARAMRFIRIGMHFLTAAQISKGGKVVDKIDLNFWDETYPAETGAGGHAHSRDMELWSFIHPAARQRVTGISLLPSDARRLPDLPIRRRRLTVLARVDNGDGLGTAYHPIPLGERLTIEAVFDLPPGTRQRFSSLFIHEVEFSGPGTGVTVQRQGPTEQKDLNILQGLITYKGLTPEEAEVVLKENRRIESNGKSHVVANTVLVRDLDFTPDQIEDHPLTVPDDRFTRLAVGAIHSLEKL